MSLAENLALVRARIKAAAERAGRDPTSVKLVAVSKTKPAQAVLEILEAGQTLFGENYVQEAKGKISEVGRDRAKWHFIGHLQSNKAKIAAELFDMIETIDSVKLGQAIDAAVRAAGRVMDVLIEVNIAGELSKSGVDPTSLPDLIRTLAKLPGLKIRGLMTMPPFLPPEQTRPYFRALRELRDRLKGEDLGVDLDELSMGMSSDMEAAIEEGATIVRVGTAIFGPRGSTLLTAP